MLEHLVKAGVIEHNGQVLVWRVNLERQVRIWRVLSCRNGSGLTLNMSRRFWHALLAISAPRVNDPCQAIVVELNAFEILRCDHQLFAGFLEHFVAVPVRV